MSNFEQDRRAEAAVAEFMDIYYYPYQGFRCVRASALDEQFAGVDVTVQSGDGSRHYVDEKASTYYVNERILPTFAFELSYVKSGGIKDGWFVRDDLRTTDYTLLWIQTNNQAASPDDITLASISELEGITVAKGEVRFYLAQQGYDKQRLVDIAAMMRAKRISQIDPPRKGMFRFRFTESLEEQPVNVVVWKTRLLEMASTHFTVTREGVQFMKQLGWRIQPR